MIAVSSLPLFVVCPRAFYFKETLPLVKGKGSKHKSARTASAVRSMSSVTPPTITRNLESPWLGMRGQCKFLSENGLRYPAVFHRTNGAKPAPEDILKLSCYSLLLENCPEGRVLDPASGEIVPVTISEPMRRGALAVLEGAKRVLALDSPPKGKKGETCKGCRYRFPCSFHEESPPDEDPWITPEQEDDEEGPTAGTLPLYLQDQGAKLGITGDTFRVTKDDKTLKTLPVSDVSQVVVFGNVQISSQALRKAFERGIPVLFYTGGFNFTGLARGLACHNSRIRPAQFASIADPDKVSLIAKAIVEAKIANSRTLLMRNGSRTDVTKTMKTLQERTVGAAGVEQLRGLEGSAARLYFQELGSLLKIRATAQGFSFGKRNRRPPADPVNALLSFGYSLLIREFTVAAEAVGLDPMHGYYHASRAMRPALALDLMEPFRPLVADSLAVTLLNKGILGMDDFRRKEKACFLTRQGRKTYIEQYEMRLNTKINYNGAGSISYRNAIRKAVQDLKAFLLGIQPEYRPLKVR